MINVLLLSTERVQTLVQISLAAGMDGQSAQHKTAGGGLPQFFGEREKILRLVGFKADDIFFVAETEGVRQVNFYILEFSPDHKVFFDELVAFFFGFIIPVAVFRARVEKMILLRARDNVKAVFGVMSAT